MFAAVILFRLNTPTDGESIIVLYKLALCVTYFGVHLIFGDMLEPSVDFFLITYTVIFTMSAISVYFVGKMVFNLRIVGKLNRWLDKDDDVLAIK
jgi:hypothetical protein